MNAANGTVLGVIAVVVLSVVGSQFAVGVGLAAPSPTDAPAQATALESDAVAQTGSYARGSPDLEAVLADPVVRPGTTPTIEVGLLNEGGYDQGGSSSQPRVTNARAVAVDAEASDAPIEVESGTIPVGTVSTEQAASAPIELSVPDDVEPGEYEVDLEVTYTYTTFVSPNGNVVDERTTDEELSVTIVVDDGPRFEIVDADTDAQIGDEGDVTATIQNTGDEVARSASVTARAVGGGVTLGDGEEAIGYVGDWDPGENRTVTFDSSVSERFAEGGYVLETVVEYRDEDGYDQTAPSARTGVFPLGEQSFEMENVSGTLEVGYEGEITGTVRNEGPSSVTSAVVAIEPISDRVSIDERRYALPELAPNETADVSFTGDVSGQADAGPRQVRFTVEYDAGDGVRTTDLSDRITIEPRTPEFDVEAENASVPAGESKQLVFTVTNQRPETLSSVRASLYADSPITVEDDEAFIDDIEPGEQREVIFEVQADSAATQKTYPLELDFRYEDEGRNDRISDVYDYPLDVTEPVESEGPSTTLLVGGAVVLALVIVGALWYRRR